MDKVFGDAKGNEDEMKKRTLFAQIMLDEQMSD